MASGSKKAVAAAIGGNGFVAVSKFIAFVMTGSGAMLSEAIHSFADTMNQVLLMIGIVRSTKAPDPDYRYGYTAERYIWALISAVGIFFLGCGVTIYHGVHSLLHPHAMESPGLALGVLTLAGVIEGGVLWVAYKAIKTDAGEMPFMEYARNYADPSAVAVLLEDAAACLGVVIAMITIGLSQLTGNPAWDSIGSILIGLLLGALAIWLIKRNHQLLAGPSVPQKERAAIRKVLEESDIIEEIVDFRTRMLGTEDYVVKANVVFEGDLISAALEPGLKAAWDGIETYEQFREFAHGHADQVTHLLGDKIDELERQIVAACSKVKHIDIEAD
jgi:zinc transporter 9